MGLKKELQYPSLPCCTRKTLVIFCIFFIFCLYSDALLSSYSFIQDGQLQFHKFFHGKRDQKHRQYTQCNKQQHQRLVRSYQIISTSHGHSNINTDMIISDIDQNKKQNVVDSATRVISYLFGISSVLPTFFIAPILSNAITFDDDVMTRNNNLISDQIHSSFTLTERESIESTISSSASRIFLPTSLSLSTISSSPSILSSSSSLLLSKEEDKGQPGDILELSEKYVSKSGDFSFSYPGSFALSTKPVKTHYDEVNSKSKDIKGFSVGVAVDPIRIKNLKEIGTANDVGNRIIALEKKKEGAIDSRLIFASEVDFTNIHKEKNMAAGNEVENKVPMYEFQYESESTRGKYTYVARAAVKKGYLYVITGQCKSADYNDPSNSQVRKILQEIVKSFMVKQD